MSTHSHKSHHVEPVCSKPASCHTPNQARPAAHAPAPGPKQTAAAHHDAPAASVSHHSAARVSDTKDALDATYEAWNGIASCHGTRTGASTPKADDKKDEDGINLAGIHVSDKQVDKIKESVASAGTKKLLSLGFRALAGIDPDPASDFALNLAAHSIDDGKLTRRELAESVGSTIGSTIGGPLGASVGSTLFGTGGAVAGAETGPGAAVTGAGGALSGSSIGYAVGSVGGGFVGSEIMGEIYDQVVGDDETVVSLWG